MSDFVINKKLNHLINLDRIMDIQVDREQFSLTFNYNTSVNCYWYFDNEQELDLFINQHLLKKGFFELNRSEK